MLEAARAGAGYAEVEAAGRHAVEPDQVLDGVRELLDDIRVEVLFGDGARVIASSIRSTGDAPDPFGPGALVIGDPSDIVVNEGRAAIELVVTSRSARRIRVSSHFPFERVNPRLDFDRDAARGYRLDLPAGGVHGLGTGRDEDEPSGCTVRLRDRRGR